MATYLDSIVHAHREQAKHDTRSLSELKQSALATQSPRSFAEALSTTPRHFGVIAEVKRRSPVMGEVGGELDPSAIASAYERGGATCISVLTDTEHFGAQPDDLAKVKAATSLPILRKDFTVCDGDVYDARAMGADAVLLIVAALSDEELLRFGRIAGELDLGALVEVHDEIEIERALRADATIIGVNQRDLHTFQVDTERAVRVRRSIPSGIIAVAESGIRNAADATVLAEAGYDAVLVGSSVVTAHNPEAAVRELSAIDRSAIGN